MNYASFTGLILALLALPLALVAAFQLFAAFRRRTDNSARAIVCVLFRLFLLLGRLVLLPLVGGIFYYQGWKLEPILQLSVLLLAIGYLGEVSISFVYDYQVLRRAARN